jgi:Fibronectin type III domain
MTAQRWIGSPAIAALLGIAFVFLASSCGQSTANNSAGTRPASAPTAVGALAGNASAFVSWTAPSSNGGAITGYTVTSSPGGVMASAVGNATNASVIGLTNGTTYTFTVTATNAAGTGPASAPSNSVTPTPPASPPPGGPAPAQLLGDWFLPEAAAMALNPPATGGPPCPNPPTPANCFIQLTLAATTYYLHIWTQLTASGDVVVNNKEIDFFNGTFCGLQLPDGVGRYTWTLTGGVLHLTALNPDPCGRDEVLAYQGWSRTH